MPNSINNQIEKQLEELFLLELKLNKLLEDKEYDSFQEQQASFSDKLKQLLDNNPQEVLSFNIEALKILQDKIKTLQTKSKASFTLLKERSLKQRRNQKNIQAYK